MLYRNSLELFHPIPIEKRDIFKKTNNTNCYWVCEETIIHLCWVCKMCITTLKNSFSSFLKGKSYHVDRSPRQLIAWEIVFKTVMFSSWIDPLLQASPAIQKQSILTKPFVIRNGMKWRRNSLRTHLENRCTK